MHCSITVTLFIVCLIAVNAATLRGTDERVLAARKRRVAICTKVNAGQYETRFVTRWTADLTATSFKGACVNMCEKLCVDYTSFDTANHKCVCSAADPMREQEPVESCTSNPCGANQICTDAGVSSTCEPMKCANPFGNPCGPGSACKDTPTGFTCNSQISSEICPVSCGPNAQCISGECKCETGFSRPKPYLGCEANPKTT